MADSKLFNFKLSPSDRADLDYLAEKCPRLDRSEVIRRLIHAQAQALRASWAQYEAEQMPPKPDAPPTS